VGPIKIKICTQFETYKNLTELYYRCTFHLRRFFFSYQQQRNIVCTIETLMQIYRKERFEQLDKAVFACGPTQNCQLFWGVGCCFVLPNTIINYSLMTPNSGYAVANDNGDRPIIN
jgi:hypothetical protein